MISNFITYTWKGVASYSYGYVLLTEHFQLDDIRQCGKPIVLWGGGPENWGARCALEKVGINVDYVCDAEILPGENRSKYMNVKNHWDVIAEADKYYHIIYENDYNKSNFKRKQVLKRLQFAGVREIGLLYDGYTKDFGCRSKIQKAVFDSINETFSNIDFIGHSNEIENCRRTSLEGLGYWDVPLMYIYSMRHNLRSNKYLEVGPGIGTMSLTLKKLMDLDMTWLNIPDEEEMWIELRRDSFKEVISKYDISIEEGFLELDDLSHMYDKYDIIVLTQVMEHFVFNPINAISKLQKMLTDEGLLFVTVPENIKHYNVKHYSDMPFPDDVDEEEQGERWIISEGWHFHEYSYDEAMDVFEKSELECVQYINSDMMHNFVLKKKGDK